MARTMVQLAQSNDAIERIGLQRREGTAMDVQLQPMNEREYQRWLEATVQDYIAEKVHAGTWTAEEAPALAQASYAELLPQGLATPTELLWTVTDAGQPVGSLWVHWDQEKHTFFVYDIVIDEAMRNQGYGQATLTALDAEARQRRVRSIGLHVFGDNQRAQHVYAKMGFVVTDINMSKVVEDTDD